MRHVPHLSNWSDDCLLALFTLTLAGISVAVFSDVLPWQAAFAVLMLPTMLLCRYVRYRAAALAAATALLAGAWIVVPPRWSLRIESEGVPAVLIFACAALLMIALPFRASQRKRARASMITPVPEPHRA